MHVTTSKKRSNGFIETRYLSGLFFALAKWIPPGNPQILKRTPHIRRFSSSAICLLAEPLLEPPDKKIHMHLEDTVLVTPQGALNITAGVPASLEEVYALVRQRALSLNQ
jgi:hypothetical protein